MEQKLILVDADLVGHKKVIEDAMTIGLAAASTLDRWSKPKFKGTKVNGKRKRNPDRWR